MNSPQAWTSPADIEAEVLKCWTKGRILTAKITGETIFPFRLRLRMPDGKALAARFDEARAWIRTLENGSRTTRGYGYDIMWSELNHRQLGRNRIPCQVVVPTEADALRLIRRGAEAERFDRLGAVIVSEFPQLTSWIARRPLLALEHAKDWGRLLAVLAWFRDHPRSGLYLRQLDIPGVDTKFIETRKGLLSELLDLVLRPAADQSGALEAVGFEGRYGLLNKPATLRFRILDRWPGLGGLSDISTPAAEFARLNLNPRVVFITENEINGLAFPPVAGGLVIFGLGYSLDLLAKARWLEQADVFYWGDIDTHGCAMLDRLRSYFPGSRALLMDQATLFAHRQLWVREDRPFTGALTRLTDSEQVLFEGLKGNQFGSNVRLEQERVPYGWVRAALATLGLV